MRLQAPTSSHKAATTIMARTSAVRSIRTTTDIKTCQITIYKDFGFARMNSMSCTSMLREDLSSSILRHQFLTSATSALKPWSRSSSKSLESSTPILTLNSVFSTVLSVIVRHSIRLSTPPRLVAW